MENTVTKCFTTYWYYLPYLCPCHSSVTWMSLGMSSVRCLNLPMKTDTELDKEDICSHLTDIKKHPFRGAFVYIFMYKSAKLLIFNVCCGERGIRTPGASQPNGFQDRRNRPLCHLSGDKSTTFFHLSKKQIK